MDEGKAFDAGESYLSDAAQAVSSKHTVSLVVALRSILQRGPRSERESPEARLVAFRVAAAELTRRGIDAGSIVRYGMSRDVIGPLLGGLIFGLIPAPTRLTPGSSPQGLDVVGWCKALGLQNWTGNETPSISEVLEFVEKAILPIVPLVENWILTASLDDLVLLSPPANLELLRTYNDPLIDELRDQYQWAVDHFTETFYDDWRTSSLHHAYRWLTQCEAPPCPAEQMQDRKIDITKLNAEIARRATSDNPEEARSLSSGALLAPEMVRYAKPLLEQGRYREAAAVFEFGAQQVPSNGELRNNLGFCLIPESPTEAFDHLKAAARLNFPRCEVIAYNQMCCLVSLQKARAAVNLADCLWECIRSRPLMGAILWQLQDDGGWRLCTAEDPRRNVAEFAAAIAVSEGWEKDEELWRDRVHYFETAEGV